MTTTPTPETHAPEDAVLTELVAELRLRSTGEVLVPGDAGYDLATLAWNVRFAHRAPVVVLPETGDDVAEAVRFARSAGLRLGVMTTGHGTVRTADGGVLVNLSRLTGVEVDAEARTARIAGGSTWAPVLEAAAAVGLAPLLGSTPHVGAVGYTLGGGMGWLARAHGLSIDKVRSFEVVTPDGERRTASADEDAELFFALCGGGAGSLGIVTAMTVELVPVDTVYAGNLVYPAEMAGEVLARWAEWVGTVPEQLTSSVVLMNFPPLDEVPEPIRGRSFAIVRGCWSGPVEEGEALLRHWREWAPPALDLFGPMPFSEVATISNDPVDPLPAAVTTEWLTDLGPEVAATLVAAAFGDGDGDGAPAGPPPLLFAEVRHAGGAIARRTGGAYGNRSSTLLLEMVGVTPTPEAELAVGAHLAAVRATLAPHATGGTYLNFTEGEEKRERAGTALAEGSHARLQAVKADVDPDDVLAFGIDLR